MKNCYWIRKHLETWFIRFFQKYLVWLCWKGCRPPSTHWRGPTTDPHGDSWLLALAPGPVRPSSSNLNPSDSSVGPMLMRALVRTPDQHDPMTNRVPSLKPSLKLASWQLDYKSTPRLPATACTNFWLPNKPTEAQTTRKSREVPFIK